MTLDFPGAGALPLTSFNSVEETSRHIEQVLSRPSLTPAPGFSRVKARVASLRFGQMQFAAIAFGTGMRVTAPINPDDGHYLIMLCLRGSGVVEYDGEAVEISVDRGVVGRPRRQLTGHFSADCERLLITMKADRASRAGDRPQPLDLRSPFLQPWLEQVRAIVSSPALAASLQRDRVVAKCMQQLLAQLFRAGQLAAERAPGAVSIAAGCVRRAEALIRSRAEEPLRLTDIAASVGVPVRTLQNNFRRYRPYSPMQYLRDIRLEMARTRLAGAADGTRVVNVALDSGFTHLGRFASEYHERFGELPSDTLRRQLERTPALRYVA